MEPTTERGKIRIRHGVGLAVLVVFWALAMYCLARGHNDRNSDEADGLLEAQDMARGQVFLPGWTVNEDSFYTLYLPVSAVLIRGFGLASGIIVGVSYAAYLLLGAGAFFAAWRRGVSPLGVALVLFLFLGLLTPFQSYLYFYFMSHTLTLACVLFALAALRLGLQAAKPAGRRGGLGLFSLLLFAAVAGDPFATYVFVVPLLGAGLLVALRRKEWGVWAKVAAAAILPVFLAKALVHFLDSRGFHINPIQHSFRDNFATLGRLPFNFRIYYNSLLALAGVYLPGWPGLSLALSMLRLAGAGVAVVLTARRLLEKNIADPDGYFLDALLLLGIALNQVEFLSYSGIYEIHEGRYLFPSVVYAAILAARRFAPMLEELWRRAGASVRGLLLGAAMAAMLLAVGPLWAIGATPVNEAEKELANWLVRHNLRSGYGGYWQANILRLVSREAVQVAPVGTSIDLKLSPYLWLAKADWFQQPANFLVYQTEADLAETAIRTLGPPSEVHRVAGFHVLVWDHDIHNQLEQPGDYHLSYPLDLTRFALGLAAEMKHNADGSLTDDMPRNFPAIIVYGPNLPLPAGNYAARFTLSAVDAAPTDSVILDVTIRHGAQALGKIKLTGAQLPAGNAPQTFTIPFASDGSGQAFEFRIWKTGRVKLTINALQVDKAGP